MRIILCSVVIFLSISSVAQPIDKFAFSVKTTFKLGESQTYEVNELFKIDNIFLGLRSEVISTVSFEVIDTAKGGYWIMYTVHVNSVKQHKDSSAYLMASLMDGMQLFFYAKDGYSYLDSPTYYKTKKRVSAKVDSMAATQTFGKSNMQYIKYLQFQLKKDAGLGFLLAPLILFEAYYSSGVYKQLDLPTDGGARDVLNKPLFSGYVQKEWKSTYKDSMRVSNTDNQIAIRKLLVKLSTKPPRNTNVGVVPARRYEFDCGLINEHLYFYLALVWADIFKNPPQRQFVTLSANRYPTNHELRLIILQAQRQ